MVYLFLVNITLLLCYIMYTAFFRKLTFFQWNRLYILLSVSSSLIIPVGLFIDLSSEIYMDERIPTIDLPPIDEAVVSIALPESQIQLGEIVAFIYWTGVLAMLIWMLIRLCYVFYQIRRNRLDFSYAFFNRIAVKEGAARADMVFNHERVHAQQGHTYDTIFLELVRAFNWFNPILSLYLKELKFQHECIADAEASMDKVAYARLLVAQAMQTDASSLLQTFSNQSLLKKRIVMLFKNKSTKRQKYLYLSIAPVLLLAAISTLVFNTSKAKNIVQYIENDIRQTELRTFVNSDAPLQPAQKPAANVMNQPTRPEPKAGRANFMNMFAGAFVSPRPLTAADKDPFMAVTFHVNTLGELSDFKLAEGTLGTAFFEESVRLIQKSNWQPALDEAGHAVAARGVVMFKLDENGRVIKDYSRIDIMPEPKGGIEKWRKFIGENYVFPKAFIDSRQKGEFKVAFQIGTTGAIEKLVVLEESFDGVAKPAGDLVHKFGAWLPGIFEGDKVAYLAVLTAQVYSDGGYGVIQVDNVRLTRIKE